ncbi:MAG TPA: glycoside hydrolase family 76 protein [Solirubrobacteraceae bacterium]|nr:glycoside hydrolase family 76 protein [Solirubrobacteraceae bacterium]
MLELMISHADYRRWLGRTCASLAVCAALVLGAASAADAASPYPAGATRPLLHARASAAKQPAKPKRPVLHGNPARALVAFEAMQKYFYIPGSGLYKGEPFSYLWPFSQSLAATVSVANIPHLGVSLAHELQARLTGLNSYLDLDNSGSSEGVYTSTLAAFDGTVAPPAGPGGTKYYDDNDWVGLELVRLYQLTHQSALLGSAEGIMAFEMAGWQERPGLACEGGLPFSNDVNDGERNTVTTAPAAELATLLYGLTHNAQYLQFAQKAYEWVRACLQQPVNLYADHIGIKGVVEPRLWSYNQGSMIGAGTLLYQATGNSAYLYQARQTANAALAYFTNERLGSEIPFFVSVYFRNLLYLDSVTHDPPGPSIAQNYVNYAWQHLRLSNNLFVFGSPPSAQLLVQAAIVQIYALLSTPANTYF